MRCFKPFENVKCSKHLKPVTRYVADKSEKITNLCDLELSKKRICTACAARIRFQTSSENEPRANLEDAALQLPGTSSTSSSSIIFAVPSTSSSSESLSSSEETNMKKKRAVEIFNSEFVKQGDPPIYVSRIHKKEQIARVSRALTEFGTCLSVPLSLAPIQEEENCKIDLYNEMLEQLKDKFNSVTNTREKIQILTVLPKSLRENVIMKEFNTSRHLVRRAKEIQLNEGVLCQPQSKTGSKSLSQETLTIVHDFYNDDNYVEAKE